ncbi:MAG: HlyD family efflux transporter periplasmic adaptor subunit [Acetanaerobacterium sp.]
MNRILYRISAVLILLGIVAFLAYQGYHYVFTPYETETAYVFVQSDYIAVSGVAVRDEVVLQTNQEGVVSYLHNNGEKVSKSMPVAEVYQSEQDAANQTAMRKLEQEIGLLETAADPGRADYINADMLNSQISEKLSLMAQMTGMRSLGALETVKTEYLMLLNTRQIATERVSNFDARLSRLRDEADSLRSVTQPALASVLAPQPGFFVSVVDGYEQMLTTAGLDTLSLSAVQQIAASKQQPVSGQGTVGKLITGFEWYYAALVPIDNAERFRSGLTVSVTFPYVSDTAYPATVSSISAAEDADYAVVVLQFNNMNTELCALRAEQAEISFASYRGLKVRSDTLRFQDGQPGVYVMNAAGVRFKMLDVIFYGDGFVLSAPGAKDDYLRMYDQMITRGKELA